MIKLVACLLTIVATLSFCSCRVTKSQIDWVDFVKINDASYEAADTVVPNEFIGEKLGEVNGNMPNEIDGDNVPKPDNGEASYLPIGTEIFAINGFSQSEYVAVAVDGEYKAYKLHDSADIAFVDEKSSTAVESTATQKPNEKTTASSASESIKTQTNQQPTTKKQEETITATAPGVGFDSEVIGNYKSSLMPQDASSSPKAELLCSKAEADEYIRKNNITSSSGGVLEALNGYGDTYFSSGELLVIEMQESSGSNKITANDVAISGNKLTVSISRSAPETGTCDMAYWYVVIAVKAGNYTKLQLNIGDNSANIPLD